MSAESLIKMANQIGQYFASEPDHAVAVRGVYQHIKSFWTPGMRQQLQGWQQMHPEAVLHPLVREALAQPEGTT
ncbi:formate dehydrogenase subunit delta [Pseudomonas thivervalensis]|uniref:Formate dehydrogenase n=1 Tax=Pseudomonas thivervalensis TaxID=86265 RepID=A0A176NIH8_9PSED|nr:formate dehydrogenase subunit delta [Pseudomonas thivervalensis]AXA53364.1 formate dehydrogenase [Pseudomonas thivervalensis]AXA58950.1 formate dehydrogenase [Pseudomonas thivervalensis]OAB50928.1 formate dehydrogenase [Pseudomonas thivervalensis]SDF41160.1 formate dehydrogenase delta subunit [Pseudomonas thivervalensis]